MRLTALRGAGAVAQRVPTPERGNQKKKSQGFFSLRISRVYQAALARVCRSRALALAFALPRLR